MKANQNSQELLKLASEAARANKHKTAIKHYKQYLKTVPEDNSVFEKLAELSELAADEISAAEWWLRSAEATKNPLHYVRLAKIENKWLKHSNAVRTLDKALALSPDYRAAHVEKLFTLSELNSNSLKNAAETFLLIEPKSATGLAFLGRALTAQGLLSEAEGPLKLALSTEPDNGYANKFYALLKVEMLQFQSAMELLLKAHEIFKRSGAKSEVDEIEILYSYIERNSDVAKRVSKFGAVKIEEQIRILGECGVKIKQPFSLPAFLKERRVTREQLEKEDPFRNLIKALCSAELIENGETFDAECIYSDGDYKRFADMFARIASGAFPLKDCDDEIAMKDDVTGEGGTALLRFTLNGKDYEWKAKVDNDWLDYRILDRLGALAIKHDKDIRFILLDGEDLIFLTAQETENLRKLTLLDFQILGTKE